MQEFTQYLKRPKWLTKDRLWNFIFWFGISSGLALAGLFKHVVTISWLTILGIPCLLKIFNDTKFIKPLVFANSEGQVLTEEQRPYMFGWMIVAALPTVFIITKKAWIIFINIPTAIIITKTFIPETISLNFIEVFIMISSLLAPISLYFIYKNCPISILFNHKFWTVEGFPETARIKKMLNVIKEDEKLAAILKEELLKEKLDK